MGQYFKLVNVDRKEFAGLPSAMKAIERVTHPVAMGMVGYLLLEGPQDGTSFAYKMDEDEVGEEEIEAYIERECEYETDRATDPEKWARRLERADGNELEAAEQMARFCASAYRDDDYSWRRDRIVTTVAAGFDIDEANDYAGRWAGDDVRLVGDYADNDLYSAMYGTIVARVGAGEEITWTGSYPQRVELLEDNGLAGTTMRHYDEDAEQGDTIRAPSRADIDVDVCTFVRYEENEWTDITDGLHEEFAQFVGESWLESNGGSGILSPDMVVST